MYELEVKSVGDGERLELPATCVQYTILSDTDESGDPQVALLTERVDDKGVA